MDAVMAFDPGTLPQLLAAFYPVVTPANLALARQEHFPTGSATG
jgi:hypothetical protein